MLLFILKEDNVRVDTSIGFPCQPFIPKKDKYEVNIISKFIIYFKFFRAEK